MVNMTRLFGYARVSTGHQENSATLQGLRLREYAAKNDLLLAGVFVDQDVSGAKPLKARPEGKKLWDALKPGDTVGVTKVDRAFRSLVDAAGTLEAWNSLGVKVVILDCGLDLSSPAGQLFFAQLASFAQFERQLLGQRLREVIGHLKAEGRPFSNYRPFGWTHAGTGKRKRFVPLAEEQELGLRVVAMRQAGSSWAEIATQLHREGITKPGKAAAVRAGKYRGAYYLETECRRLCKAALAGFPIAPRSTKPMAATGRAGKLA
jgi:DNA invertase Pin-like site-specific DNA recombinase